MKMDNQKAVMNVILRSVGAALVLALMGVVASFAHARQARPSDEPVVKGSLGREMHTRVTDVGGEDFWGAVLVAKKGKVVLAHGYGLADHERMPFTPLTLFEVASISKQFTAAAILRLAQDGKLKVTDTLDSFFKHLPEYASKIQIHHLITHTSGLAPAVEPPYASDMSRDEAVRFILRRDPVAEPGAEFRYSNAGYSLLAAVIEEASGKSFEDYLRKTLFKPAGMDDTGFISDKRLVRKKNVATRRSGDGREWTAADWHWGWGYRGMGGVVTHLYDMLKWDRALRGEKILSKKFKKIFYAPEKKAYAYGWYVHHMGRNSRRVEHTGNVPSLGSMFVRYLEEDLTVVVFSKHAKPAYEVARALEALAR